MPLPRPDQPETPARDAFLIQRSEVDDGLSLAYLREGAGGYPLLLIHGYPETKRIWWRNVRPLAEAGHEMIVPDLRGYGDSDLSTKDDYDIVRYGRDLYALVHDVLGHERCGVIAGDVGGAVAYDMANRFDGFVERMVFFNTVAPVIPDQPEWYAERGLSMNALEDGPTGDYRLRQGRDWQALLAELDTPARRRQWVRDFYEHRLLAAQHSFDEDDFDFMTEPFADADRLAASWAPYQLAYGRPMTDIPMLFTQCDIPTVVLYGPEDHLVGEDFMKRCELAFTQRVGPLLVPECGHFLQWERADILNEVSKFFFAELRTP